MKVEACNEKDREDQYKENEESGASDRHRFRSRFQPRGIINYPITGL